jgi:low molecular weight protein-tyrosine phosphatase
MTAKPVSVAQVRTVAGRLVRAVRQRSDRALGPWRHRKAMQAVRSMPLPARILVICHGNVCRSPYLEAVLRRELPHVQVTSAGFVGPGRSVPQESLDVADKRGIDLRQHRSRVLTPQIAQAADLVIVMDRYQATRLARWFRVPRERIIHAGDLDPTVGPTRTIVDPWRQSIEVFEGCFTRLERCARELAGVIG